MGTYGAVRALVLLPASWGAYRHRGAVAEWLSRQDMDGDMRSPLPAMLDPAPLVHPAMPTSGSADAPPCAEINWKRGDQRWLVAESWWQGDVAPPKFRRLALWSIPKLPAIAVDFFVTRLLISLLY